MKATKAGYVPAMCRVFEVEVRAVRRLGTSRLVETITWVGDMSYAEYDRLVESNSYTGGGVNRRYTGVDILEYTLPKA